jgi:hypothetical protein
MRGSCLCGSVKFEISGDLPGIYQCHCSLCRKEGGSAANASVVIDAANVSWIAGRELISSYVRPTGFRTDFCSRCGSPVPHPLRTTAYYWVPVGLFDDEADLKVVAHVFTDSKASWDMISPHGRRFEAAPELAEFMALMRPGRDEK